MDTRGTHLLVEIRGAERGLLDDAKLIEQLLIEAATRASARVIQAAFHRFQPEGVTGFLLLEESHLSIHTWPGQGYAAVDFYTCGAADPQPGVTFLAQGLGATHLEWLSVRRGESTLRKPKDGSFTIEG
jgi:S-adenosylmethionine decarboxylase